MSRRTFLKRAVAGVAALFVPAVTAKAQLPRLGNTGTTIAPKGLRRVIYAGDICVWDGASYRPAQARDDINLPENRVAIAVPDGNGGFLYMREGVFAVQVAT